MSIVTLIALVSSVCAAMPRIAGAAVRAAAPVPAPQTDLGREIQALLLVLRPGLVLVPVGIVVAAIRRTRSKRWAPAPRLTGACAGCWLTESTSDAAYCRRCGERLISAKEAAR